MLSGMPPDIGLFERSNLRRFDKFSIVLGILPVNILSYAIKDPVISKINIDNLERILLSNGYIINESIITIYMVSAATYLVSSMQS